MLRREAIEQPAELALGLQDVADVGLEGEDHIPLLRHGKKGLERVVESLHASSLEFLGVSVQSPLPSSCVPVSVATT